MKLNTHISVFIFMLIFIGVMLFSFGVETHAQNYVPLSPLPGTGNVDTSDPAGYFSNIFQIAIGIAGILAVIVIMFYGLQYMMSASEGKKSAAKTGITSVVFGIAILFLSWLILTTINPDLVKLRFFDTFKEFENQSRGGIPDPAAPEFIDNTEDNTGTAPSPIIDSFSGSPDTVVAGIDTLTFEWSSSNTVFCNGENFSTGGDTEGTVTVPTPDPGGFIRPDFRLTCNNIDGEFIERIDQIYIVSDTRTANDTIYDVIEKSTTSSCPDKAGYIKPGISLPTQCYNVLTDSNKYGCCVYTPDDSLSPSISSSWCYQAVSLEWCVPLFPSRCWTIATQFSCHLDQSECQTAEEAETREKTQFCTEN